MQPQLVLPLYRVQVRTLDPQVRRLRRSRIHPATRRHLLPGLDRHQIGRRVVQLAQGLLLLVSRRPSAASNREVVEAHAEFA